MQVKAKAPPANCMWIAFTEKPKIELSILPVRSQKFFKLNMIGKLIHRIIGDVIEHNLVLPNMVHLKKKKKKKERKKERK
jgi:hypothetical protein